MPVADRPEPSTATLVLLGDWFAPHRQRFWLGEMIEAAACVGVNPRSTRTVIQRFANDGWFDVERLGRRSRYSLTPHGRLELERGDVRILGQSRTRRAAPWTVVSVDTPDLDPKLGKELAWLGLAQLRRNLWIGPYAPDDELMRVLSGVECDVFEQARFGADSELVSRCWDLGAAEALYGTVLELESHEMSCLDPADAFRRRFWLNYRFLLALRIDPELPAAMLPSNWAGVRARTVFETMRPRLQDPAFAYLRELGASHEPI